MTAKHLPAPTEGEWDYYVGNANGKGLIRIEQLGTGVHIGSMVRGLQSEANAAFITEAKKVATETGMTPRQLADAWQRERTMLLECEKERAELLAALKIAKGHIEHMARFIGQKGVGYHFESLGEDMPGIDAAIAKATGAA